MFGVVWLVWFLWTTRPPFGIASRWISSAAVTASIGCIFFLMPYFSANSDESGKGGAEELPEVTFLFHILSMIRLSPHLSVRVVISENVLSSLHRGIDSAWPADYVLDPGHGVLAFSIGCILGWCPTGISHKKSQNMVAFVAHILAGYSWSILKLGAQKDTADVFMLGEYVVRFHMLGCSNIYLVCPECLHPIVWHPWWCVCAVILVAVNMDRLNETWKRWGGFVLIFMIVLQPFYRFDLEELAEWDAKPSMWRIPLQILSNEGP